MSGSVLRKILRITHMVGGFFMGLYIYAPFPRQSPQFDLIMQVLVVPLVLLTGIGMWQQGKLMKLLNRGDARTTSAPPGD